MKENRLRNFLGKTIKFNEYDIHPPTIDSIAEIGEFEYSLNTILASFDKETILKSIIRLSQDDYKQVENEDTYDLLTSLPLIIQSTEKAISFFTKQNIIFDRFNRSYLIKNEDQEDVFVDKNNYIEFSKIIKEINCVSDEKQDDGVKFKNDKAREMYEQLKKYKKNKEDSTSLDIKDILSILCNVDGNGINIFNVGNLTIYQMYEHFERFNLKEHHQRIVRVWANGYLGKNDKLPEWVVKSKL